MVGATRIGVSFFFQSKICDFVCRGFAFRVDRTGRDRSGDFVSEERGDVELTITWEEGWYGYV